jgi:hypothetical protein
MGETFGRHGSVDPETAQLVEDLTALEVRNPLPVGQQTVKDGLRVIAEHASGMSAPEGSLTEVEGTSGRACPCGERPLLEHGQQPEEVGERGLGERADGWFARKRAHGRQVPSAFALVALEARLPALLVLVATSHRALHLEIVVTQPLRCGDCSLSSNVAHMRDIRFR